jgi:predicted ATPase
MEAIHQALLLAAEHKRILVVMDNAHWSDESTNHTLAYLTERISFTNTQFVVDRPYR